MAEKSLPAHIASRLNAQQREALQLIADGVDHETAGATVGYSNPKQSIRYLLTTSAAHFEIQKFLLSKLSAEIAPKAISTIFQLIESSTTSDSVKLKAAQIVLDRVGIVPLKAPEESAGRDLEDMSVDELKALVARIEDKRAADAVPVSRANNPQLDEMFE